ncbi:MAG: hypothetical protein K8H87_06250 [Pseudorhodoplanes sp.]|nr:hypothetical protein [Pseudorhodoplanes sp.]
MTKGIRFLKFIQRHCFVLAELHKRATETYARRAARLTIINVFSSIMILFFAANDDAKTILRDIVTWLLSCISISIKGDVDIGLVTIGILGAIAVFTAAMQYLLKYEERNLIHKYISADYENLFRKSGRYLAKETINEEDVHRLNKQLNYIARHSPPIASHILNKQPEIEKIWESLAGSFGAVGDSVPPSNSNT